MAKLKATPKSFDQAAEILAGRSSVRLGNNTYLEQQHALEIVVRLHRTAIVKFHADGQVTLHTGGYRTVTTKERINQFIKGHVYQRDYAWFYVYPITPGNDAATYAERTSPFTEGISVA